MLVYVLNKRGTGKTTEEMKQALTYSGWDFENIWDIIEGESYLFLITTGGAPIEIIKRYIESQGEKG